MDWATVSALATAGGTLVLAAATFAITGRTPMMVDLLYGDHEGGQRAITRFALYPMDNGGWRPSTARHWNLDRPDPR